VGMAKVGILTAGGDCPGLNSAIVEAVYEIKRRKMKPVLIRNGYKGLLDAADGEHDKSVMNLDLVDLDTVHGSGGTFIGSSRTKLKDDSLNKAVKGAENLKLSSLIVIGGDGSLLSANRLSKHLTVAAIPKTIDNDVAATDLSIGFSTAVETAVTCVENIKDTARSHGTFFFVEVMGRRSGFLAAHTATGTRANCLLVPESPWSLNSVLPRIVEGGVAVVSEGAWCPELGSDAGRGPGGQLAGVADKIVEKISESTPERPQPKVKLRAVTLGHVLRGGRPSAADRVLATRLARQAVELTHQGRSGLCVAVNGKITSVNLDQTELGRKYLSALDLYELAGMLPGQN